MPTKPKTTTADLLAEAARPISDQMSVLTKQITYDREQLDEAIAKLRTKFDADSAELVSSYRELFDALTRIAPSEVERFEDPDVLLGKPKDRPTRGAPRGNGRRPRGAFDEAAVLDFIRSQPEPVGAGDIKTHAGDVSGATLSNSLRRLVDEGKLTRTGEKRGTKYSARNKRPITDLMTPKTRAQP